MPNDTLGRKDTTAVSPTRVIPLLEALNRVEGNVSALALRLDPITNHVPLNADKEQRTVSVTARLNQLGDALQYLLDNIEL